MLETYQGEIIRKKRSSRIFWIIVFFFAGLLYFFFQGYYPSIDLSIRSLTATGERTAEPRDLIRSFGIVNVSVKPDTATIILSGDIYNNDEKRMTNYGTYSLLMSHAWYMSYKSALTIGKETPYYIDLLTLLPTVKYTQYGTGISHIANIRTNTWTAHTASGMILYDENFSGKTLISRSVLTHIGEWYFLSWANIKIYVNQEIGWEDKIWSGSTTFIRECGKNILIKESNLWCPKNKKILTEKWKIFTWVLSIGENYIQKNDSLLVEDGYSKKIAFSTGREISSNIFIEKDATWYTASGGSLISLWGTGKKWTLSIKSPLDSLEYARWIDWILILLGKKWEQRFLVFHEQSREKFSDLIPFPNITLDEIRIVKQDGNIFFKTKSALLFLYHNSADIQWLIDGDILALSSESALYEKDGAIWKASWKWEE